MAWGRPGVTLVVFSAAWGCTGATPVQFRVAGGRPGVTLVVFFVAWCAHPLRISAKSPNPLQVWLEVRTLSKFWLPYAQKSEPFVNIRHKCEPFR